MIKNEAQGVSDYHEGWRMECWEDKGKKRGGAMRSSEWKEQELETTEYIWELQFRCILVGIANNIDTVTPSRPSRKTHKKLVPFLRTHAFLLLKELGNSFHVVVSGLTVSHIVFL